VATKKQRRRQLKERRHEYEYVYVDDEGQEVEVEEPQPSASPAKAAKDVKGRGRPGREPKPPSWERQFKRAPFFGVLLFLVTSFGHHPALGTRIEFAVLYTALFIPLMYLFERSLYRTFLRRTGKLPPPGSRRS
jgi:hypothetical protein